MVALHAKATYRVYMCGFTPGQTYLGGVPDALEISRRPTPRPPHPAGSVLIGGGLCTIAPFVMPTGWYVIGRTPERLYAAERKHAFLIQAGDLLRFEPIDLATFRDLEAAGGQRRNRCPQASRMTAAVADAILRILSAGPGVTLQDAGRHGYLRFGVTAAGPMDALAHATANLAVGNPAGATALEVSVGGIEVTAESAPLSYCRSRRRIFAQPRWPAAAACGGAQSR